MREIPLTRGQVAIIDDEDYERVGKRRWLARPGRNGKWYAATKIQRKPIMLHRFILNAPPDLEVDHKNGDSLDCRRSNLRLATRCQNNQNHPKRRTNTTGFKGVQFRSDNKKNPWRARIDFERQQIQLGCHPTAEQAARVYDQHARLLFGEFARLNFPEG